MIFPLVELGEFSTAVPIGEEAIRIADAADTAHSQVEGVPKVLICYP
jgi:hypothetical protein